MSTWCRRPRRCTPPSTWCPPPSQASSPPLRTSTKSTPATFASSTGSWSPWGRWYTLCWLQEEPRWNHCKDRRRYAPPLLQRGRLPHAGSPFFSQSLGSFNSCSYAGDGDGESMRHWGHNGVRHHSLRDPVSHGGQLPLGGLLRPQACRATTYRPTSSLPWGEETNSN